MKQTLVLVIWALLAALVMAAPTYNRVSWFDNSACSGAAFTQYLESGVCFFSSWNTSLQLDCSLGGSVVNMTIYMGKTCGGTPTPAPIQGPGCHKVPVYKGASNEHNISLLL